LPDLARAEDAGMDLGLALPTVILFALMLATIAGFIAARFLTHAAQSRSPRSDTHDS
jgi:hypothetical protein